MPYSSFCSQKICDQNFTLISCKDKSENFISCEIEDCKREKCMNEMLTYPYTSVCGEGDVLYDSHYDYCSQVAKELV